VDADLSRILVSYDGLAAPIEVAKGKATLEVSGLIGGTAYSFTVKACDSSGNESVGVNVSCTPLSFPADTTAPADVTGLSATQGVKKVTLAWTDPTDTDLSKILVSYNGITTPLEVAKGVSTLEISSLTGGTVYTFTVKACDSSGNESMGKTVTTNPYAYTSTEYFNITEGYGIRYHVTDEDSSFDQYMWAVSQAHDTTRDFVFTLNVEDGTTSSTSSSLAGYLSRTYSSRKLTCINSGYPVQNQGQFYFMFTLPAEFNYGDSWTFGEKTYVVSAVDSQTINGTIFPDCIKVSVTDPQTSNQSAYLKGSGCILLARGIGIVAIHFTRDRDTNKEVYFQYLSQVSFVVHTISGTILNSGIAVSGYCVQISNASWGTRSVTDADGKFSLSAYGPDIRLRIGADANDDGVFDTLTTGTYWQTWIQDINSDVTDLSIDLSSL